MTRRGSGDRRASGGGSSFFGSRLRAPSNPGHYLRRPRLIALLDQATSAPITMVVAPAGSGKTSLLVDWLSLSTVPAAWLSVDEADRDGGQLWAAAAIALGELVDVGGEALVPRHRGARADGAAQLVAALDDGPHPDSAILIVDDLHLVDDSESVTDSLASFLMALPQWLHVVVLSRRTPKLPVDRLRARGQLAEIHFTELRFSPDEAERMLGLMDTTMSRDELDEAVDRAAGWAAGLQLAALAARSEEAQPASMPRVDARGLLVTDYVWREVLAAERPELVDVLLDTSVVTRTNAALAVALSGRPDAGDLLLEAEARGLFVTRLGPSGWFEVHAVVRHELLAEAARRSPQHVSDTHARAARWFEDAGEVTSALEHWLLAGRPRETLHLLAEQMASLYDSGRAATIVRTVAQIPPNVASADLPAMIEFAWCHLLVDKAQFLEAVGLATTAQDRSAAPEAVAAGRLRMLESFAAAMTGDWEASGRLATQAMTVLSEASAEDALGRFGWNVVAREIALCERWDDGSDQLQEVRAHLAQDPDRRLGYEGTRALGEALAGRPVDALRIAAGIRDVGSVASIAVLSAELGLAEAVAHRELGDRPRAVTELMSVTTSLLVPLTHAQAVALLELTELRLDEGDLEAADACFERAHELVRREFAGPGGLRCLARTGNLLALATGRVLEARAWAGQIDDPFWTGVATARVCLAEGHRSQAVELLEEAVPRCPRHEVVRDLLRARATDDHAHALALAAAAVSRSIALGLVQTVASEGADVLELLEIQAFLAPTTWLDRVRRAAHPVGAAPLGQPFVPPEPLTDRELEVLRLLPSRLTLREIADELFISVNTLKFHLKVIYRKLGVGSRADAAATVRHLAQAGLARSRTGVGHG